jgi:soluble lytic murein transglycosylase-like protein
MRWVPSAYQAAANEAIPATLLWAVALQESGWLRRSREVPWPWTLNVAGQPARFATRASACRALHRVLKKTSPRRVDVGLAQVSWGYHHEDLRSPCDLLDPYRNLAIAARLLRELHQDGESWVFTAGRYHRPAGGEEAARYRNALRLRLVKLEPRDPRAALSMRNTRMAALRS